MAEIISIIILGILVIAQAVERYFFSQHMTKQLEQCMKAVLSRNINDYLTATAEKSPKSDFTENDEVDLNEASDEVFDKFIKEQTK